jgi:hypothetical protein
MADPRERVKGPGASKVEQKKGQASANEKSKGDRGGPSAGDDPRAQQGTQRG